ncbi:extracellular solute-binding protein, family 1 [Citreicella sp. 357]|nr:extracellular solute-binding protein, family 1 [Citreicella sp. 357]
MLKRRLLSSMAAGFVLRLLLMSVLLWNYSRAAANRAFDLFLAGAALAVLERVSYNSDGPTVDLPQSAMDILALALAPAVDADSPDAMRARMIKAEAQVQRTVHLTNQLLANAVAIHRSDRAQPDPPEPRPLVCDTLAKLPRDRRLRKVTVSYEDGQLPDGVGHIRWDAISIREALRNLIDNAVRHGRSDNSVLIELDGDARSIRLTVSDVGPGIPAAAQSRATERFISIARDTAGSGLGLAIVRSVAEGHDARLEPGASHLGGLRAVLVFPRFGALLLGLCLLMPQASRAWDLTIYGATDLPTSHRDLSPFIRDHEAAPKRRVGGYDLRGSGIGYLFATQDMIQSVQTQRLTEVPGRAAMRVYCRTSDMIKATGSGEIALALDVIGPSAIALAQVYPEVGIHVLDDDNLGMSRTAFVPRTAQEPEMGARFIAFLLSPDGQALIDRDTAPDRACPGNRTAHRVGRAAACEQRRFLPIPLGPGLLTFLDRLKRDEVLRGDASFAGEGGKRRR